MESWPGPLESARNVVVHALRWLADALLLTLVATTMALLVSQVVGLWKEPLRLPLVPVAAVCVLTVVVLWLVGPDRAIHALRGGLWFIAVMAATGLIVGVAAWGLGQYLADRREPVTIPGLWLGFGVSTWIALVSLTLATLAAWNAYTGVVNVGFVALAVLAVMALSLGFLTARDPRWRLDPEGQQIKQRGLGRIDVLLVVDPHDPAGRALIAEAKDHGEELRRPPQDTVDFDIKFGLAVLGSPQNLSPGSRANFVSALGEVPPAGGPPAYGSYGRTLLDAVEGSAVTWREASRRAVVFVASRAPSEEELGADFQAALAAHQETVLSGAGALTSGPQSSLAVYMVAPAGDAEAGTWRGWTQATGGRLIDTGAYERQTSLQAIEDALTDSPVRTARDLADLYRPYLNLARREPTKLVDVDALLQAKPKEIPNRVCDRERLGRDDCVDVSSALRLLQDPDGQLREQDEYIDFEEDVREAFHGQGPKVATRMYFHMRRRDGLLHIGYWWFLPVNVSPIQVNETCLPGLTLSELTCYDHEGDWEGVTVTLEPRALDETPSGDPYNPAAFDPDAWKVRSVTYDAHGRGIRWPWELLKGTPAVEGSTHPVVFSARGSHASYPLPCEKNCDQQLARSGLPEGPFNGTTDTRMTCDGCLTPLPSLRRQSPFTRPVEREEDPVLWNAFPGRWGAAVCLPVGQVCSQSDGPRSPSRQDRYRRPWEALDPDKKTRARFNRIVARGERG